MRNDIIKLTDDEESSLSIDDYYNLGMQIHNLCLCDGRDERKQALIKLRYNLFSLPNKKQTWNDIIILANTKDGNLSRDASSVLFSALSLVPDKQQAWNDLLQLLDSEYSYTKRSAASALGYAFVQLQDKKQPWEILHKLADSNDVSIKQGMAHSLGYVFSQLQDRKQAWNDLHKLTEDPDSEVRRRAVTSLGTAFFYVPDKQQAWDDLHRLVSDDTVVRVEVATVLGFIFSYLPNKSQACTDLISMADEVIESDENVKTQANYSLGRVFVYLASKAKDDEDYKIKFDKAITHFRRAAENSLYDWLNPSRFCLPLYRLFYSVVFETLEGKEDTQEYLDEAERELETSGKKRQFIDIVKHLIAAANEIQNLDGLDIKEKRERGHGVAVGAQHPVRHDQLHPGLERHGRHPLPQPARPGQAIFDPHPMLGVGQHHRHLPGGATGRATVPL